MDHVNRGKQIARLQRIERKIKESRQRQNKSHKKPQHTLAKFLRSFKISHNTTLILKGAAVGVVITAIAWLSESNWIEDRISMIAQITSDANQTSQNASPLAAQPEIKQSDYDFDLINLRMKLLTHYANNLEDKLTHFISLTESIIDKERRYVTASREKSYEFSSGGSVFETNHSIAANPVSGPPTIKKIFTATHIVTARLNLRRSASSEATTIAVMKTGSKVEYISQHGDWYYVNAPSYGEGWCSSDYLSLVPQNPQRTTALGVDSGTSKMDVIFTPTHIVKSRLNLRRSASSKAMSIAVMEAGSKVHYMRESDGWYYVNAPSYGKGWCSSEYLSPLNQQYASVN